MPNDKKQSAHYQVTLFLRSEKSFELKLDVFDRMILRVIADYIDMPLGYCCVKQILLAKECGMCERQLRMSSEKLIKLKVLFRFLRGKLYFYELGEEITGVEN